MNSILKFTKAEVFLNDLYDECYNNEVFKKNLMDNPEEAIENFKNVQMSIPDGMSFQVEDQSDSSVIYWNIPRKVEIDSLELSEEQMEAVSGGDGGLTLGGAILLGLIGAAIYDVVDGFLSEASNGECS